MITNLLVSDDLKKRMVTTRVCKACLRELDILCFSRRTGRTPDSFHWVCRTCATEKHMTHYRVVKEQKPFVLRCYAIKAKCNQFDLPFDLTPDYLKSIWTGFCAISGQEIYLQADRSDPFHAELDRTFPHRGYIKGNVVWASRKFNGLKRDATLEDFRCLIKYLAKAYGDV